jgi:hypothetical protein
MHIQCVIYIYNYTISVFLFFFLYFLDHIFFTFLKSLIFLWHIYIYFSHTLLSTASALRVKRQDSTTAKTEESFEKELCKDKDAGEWFRLVAGDGDACRDVIQCTSSVSLSYFFFLMLMSFHSSSA